MTILTAMAADDLEQARIAEILADRSAAEARLQASEGGLRARRFNAWRAYVEGQAAAGYPAAGVIPVHTLRDEVRGVFRRIERITEIKNVLVFHACDEYAIGTDLAIWDFSYYRLASDRSPVMWRNVGRLSSTSPQLGSLLPHKKQLVGGIGDPPDSAAEQL